MSGRRLVAAEDVLGGSSPLYYVKDKELRRATQRYVALHDCPGLSKVKAAMTQYIEPERMYTGASVACR